MSNPYGGPDDENPFGNSDYGNPFESGGAGGGAGGDFQDSFPGADEGGFPGVDEENPSFSTGGGGESSADLERRARELDKREKELQRRQEHMSKQANKLDRHGRVKNWPFSFWAIAYHSIKDDILPKHKNLVRQFYVLWWLLMLTILWNWVVIVVIAAGGKKHNLGWPDDFDAIFASVYLLVVPFFSWRCWYRPWYNWCKQEKGYFMWFTVWFFIHTVWVILMAVGIPTGSGLMVMLDQFNGGNDVLGIFSLVGLILWGIQSAWSIYLYNRARLAWKHSGIDEYVRQEARKMATAEAKKEFGGDANDGW